MKIKKKFTTGTAQTFISRKRALKKLQLTLKDFRRLCILKGIYPREPKHIKKTNKGGSTQNRIYYHLKDIIFLSQESLIGKFREYKTFLRKVNHARAKRNDIKVQTLFKSKPIFNYDHIVKERFPTFTSALRDLDDALCLCFAFASLTQSPLANQKVIKRCKRLVTEFMHFVIEAKALTKVFISIKGIYYQAEIMGERVTWISGHERSVGRANELDFTAMANFVDFYTCMLAFVNFRLFKSIGLFYPPQLQQQQQMMAENEYDFKQLDTDDRVYSLAFPLRRTEKTEEPDVEMDTFAEDNTDGADFLEKLRQAEALKKLFSKFKFFLNREVPKESLAFVIRSCGGFVRWDGCAPNSITESSELITHQVVDRDLEKMDMSRVYVQPQWVFDCFNARRLLPTLKYAPSAVLPPHLSPFVDENTIHSVRTELEEELKDSNKTDTGSVQKTQKQPKKVETVDNKGVMRVQKSRVFKESQQKKTNEEGHNLKLREMMIPKRHKRVYEKIKRGAKSKEKAVNNLNRKRAKLDTSAGA